MCNLCTFSVGDQPMCNLYAFAGVAVRLRLLKDGQRGLEKGKKVAYVICELSHRQNVVGCALKNTLSASFPQLPTKAGAATNITKLN